MPTTAKIHLQLDGNERIIETPIPFGEQSVQTLFPAARAIVHQIVDQAVAAAEREGRQVSCCAGCGACCRQLVVISLADASALADLVAAMPAERQVVIRERFAQAIARLEAAGLLDAAEPHGERHLVQPVRSAGALPPLAVRYFQQQIACPFLEEESCSIHPDRPLVCREYLVTSPAERCSRLFSEPVDKLELPVYVADAMVRTIHRVAGAPLEAIPLVLALEWAEAHPQALSHQADGLAMLTALVEEVEAGAMKEGG
jgi:Fe-S-cluster containining protein